MASGSFNMGGLPMGNKSKHPITIDLTLDDDDDDDLLPRTSSEAVLSKTPEPSKNAAIRSIRTNANNITFGATRGLLISEGLGHNSRELNGIDPKLLSLERRHSHMQNNTSSSFKSSLSSNAPPTSKSLNSSSNFRKTGRVSTAETFRRNDTSSFPAKLPIITRDSQSQRLQSPVHTPLETRLHSRNCSYSSSLFQSSVSSSESSEPDDISSPRPTKRRHEASPAQFAKRPRLNSPPAFKRPRPKIAPSRLPADQLKEISFDSHRPERRAAAAASRQKSKSQAILLDPNRQTIDLQALSNLLQNTNGPLDASEIGIEEAETRQTSVSKSTTIHSTQSLVPDLSTRLLSCARIRSNQPYFDQPTREGLVRIVKRGLLHQLRPPIGSILHVDFTRSELSKIVAATLGQHQNISKTNFKTNLVSFRQVIYASKSLHRLSGEVLRNSDVKRSIEDVVAFFKDVIDDSCSSDPRFIEVTRKLPSATPLSSALLNREFRTRRTPGCHTNNVALSKSSPGNLSSGCYRLSLLWGSTSGDINTAAWFSDSDRFILGSTVPNDHYNKNNNLMIASCKTETVRELPEHRSIPLKTFSISHDWMYETISSATTLLPFDRFATASYDKTVKIWDPLSSDINQTYCIATLKHDSKVNVIAYSRSHDRLATGMQSAVGSINIFEAVGEDNTPLEYVRKAHPLTCAKAKQHQHLDIWPECLEWGSHPLTNNLLLAGLLPNKVGITRLEARSGSTIVFDAERGESQTVIASAQAVSAARWLLDEPLFVTASSPTQASKSSNIANVVRIYDFKRISTPGVSGAHWQRRQELESSSGDPNMIVLNAQDPNVLTVAYNDGTMRMWDRRFPNDLLHLLKHGPSLNRTEEDVFGVNFASFGPRQDLLYSGSSDGIVKVWNYKRNPTDAWVENILSIDCGIHSGEFSPDYSKLLIGDSSGRVHIMTISDGLDDFDTRPPRCKEMDYIGEKSTESLERINEGAIAARALVYSGAVRMTPSGPVQGPMARATTRSTETGPSVDAATEAVYASVAAEQEKERRVRKLWSFLEEKRLSKRDQRIGPSIDAQGELILVGDGESDEDLTSLVTGFHPDDHYRPFEEPSGHDC